MPQVLNLRLPERAFGPFDIKLVLPQYSEYVSDMLQVVSPVLDVDQYIIKENQDILA